MYASSEMPRIDRIAPNFHRADVNGFGVWFSYNTPIAFIGPDGNRVVRRNEWGPTTGKHLNAIDGGDKDSRVDRDRFADLWRQATGSVPAIS